MKDKSLFSSVALTKRSMCGSGKHTRHIPFFFLTTTGLASQSGYLTYGSDFEEFFGLIINCTSALWSQLSSLLFERFESRVDVELVTCDVDINPWHVLCGPCECVQILFRAAMSSTFKDTQVRADLNKSIWECFV